MNRALSLPRLAVLLCLLLAVLGVRAAPAYADPQDIAAASRSVVRVALVASRDGSAYFVGHGSGIVVAPDKVLTNAHVVELARTEPNILIGVIPPQGTQSYGARVIAFSPGNDLALVQISGGKLLPATFFANATQDGQQVVAIGYPGNVDRAQGMSVADIIQPVSPVKTIGNISAGRSSKQFDTVLHTAPMAAGNSGGPLVDECGRVLGVNSFGALSDGMDAEYGFAVSNREVASFLRQAGVQPLRTVLACRSLAELDAADRAASAQDKLQAEQQAAAAADAEREATLRAREDATQSVIAARENYMAVAAALLTLGLLTGFGAGIGAMRGREKLARNLGIGAAILFVGAIAAFFLRPGFGEVDDRAAAIRNDMAASSAGTASAPIADAGQTVIGDNICHLDVERSRVTVSDTGDLPLNWGTDGCVNGKTQYGRNGNQWTRIILRGEDATARAMSFDPDSATLRIDSYALDTPTADAMAKLVAKDQGGTCTTDSAALDALARRDSELRALLPAAPNERLIYHCTKGTLPEAP